MRPVRVRGHHLRPLQRDPPVLLPFHALRRQARQEGDQEADPRVSGGQDRRGGLRRQGQHGRPQDAGLGLRPQERGGGPRRHDRRGDRGLQAAQRRRRPPLLRLQRDPVPPEVVLGAGRDDGRRGAGLRGQQPLHLLRRVQAQAYERRGQEDRREVPGDRPQPGRHGPVDNDELRQGGRGEAGQARPAREGPAGARAQVPAAQDDTGEGDAALRDRIRAGVLGRGVPLLEGGPQEPVPRHSGQPRGPLARVQVQHPLIV